MFDARVLARAAISECEALRQACKGDELALARTHSDAQGMLPRILQVMREALSTVGHLRSNKPRATMHARSIAMSPLA
jgi:hypothetical protein